MKFIKGFLRFMLFVVLFTSSALICLAQQNTGKMGKIAILSFNGGSSDERDGIAELFSFTPAIMNGFIVIPRTNIINAIN